jgi:hypothetical protein
VCLEFSRKIGIVFAGNELQIQTDSTWVAEIANFIFRHHLHRATNETCAKVEVLRSAPGDGFHLIANGELAAIASTASELPVTLMQVVQRQLIFGETQTAMLHAAVLSKEGFSLLFPAAAGSGKSTLTAWLMGHGYGLLSDELASVDASGQVDGFTRPLNIKPGSRPLLDQFEWMRPALVQALLSCNTTLIPWPREASVSSPIFAIVEPLYEPDKSFTAERMSHGRCAAQLMRCLLNARNLPKHGLSAVTRIAERCQGYRIGYSKLADVSTWLAQLQMYEV